MISALIIVFREVLEAALVLGVLLAATRGVRGSRRWIAVGSAVGCAGATVVALFMSELEGSFSGDGEFLYNAALLAVASALIGWTVVWMGRHGREMASRMRNIGRSVESGDLPKTALAVVSMAAVMREGGEAVFFLFGAAEAAQQDGPTMLGGSVLGILLGVATGYGLYRGLLHIPVKYLFRVIGWLLMLLAAGMASQAAENLVAIEVLPPLVDPLWDTSSWLPQSGVVGSLLHVLAGYNDHPTGIQILIFVLVLGLISLLCVRGDPEGRRARHAGPEREVGDGGATIVRNGVDSPRGSH